MFYCDIITTYNIIKNTRFPISVGNNTKYMPNKKSKIRKSYFLNKYVVITPGRAKRPRDIEEKTVVKRVGNCPFCPEKIKKDIILDKITKPNKKDWEVISIANIFPAVTLDNKKAYGAQEVIVEMQNHQKDLGDMPITHIEKVLQMYVSRTKNLTKNKELDYILCFKNQGSKAGASIVHAHSQVFATKIIPTDLKEEARLALDYKEKHKTCPYCDIIKKERGSKREIYNDKNIIAFTPYASEFHYETWIFPKKHIDNITLLSKDELKSFAKALKMILSKLDSINVSFNFFLHNVISNKNQHFYIKIQPRDSIWAGVELGSGLVINSISPEAAAKFYKLN